MGTAALIMAGAALVVSVISAVNEAQNAEDQLDLQEEQFKTELGLQKTQLELSIENMENQIRQGEQEIVGLVGETGYAGEFGQTRRKVGVEAAETGSAQLARYGFMGVELGAGGSPLVVMTETARKAQEDISYVQSYYGNLLSAKQGEIASYYEQVGLMREQVASLEQQLAELNAPPAAPAEEPERERPDREEMAASLVYAPVVKSAKAAKPVTQRSLLG